MTLFRRFREIENVNPKANFTRSEIYELASCTVTCKNLHALRTRDDMIFFSHIDTDTEIFININISLQTEVDR